MMRSALIELLEESGAHQIESAPDPVAAVQMLMHGTPQIIVLDTTWTEINGVCLSRMMREMAPHAKIVLLVDEEWREDAELQRSSGADEFVVKANLSSRLREILGAAKH